MSINYIQLNYLKRWRQAPNSSSQRSPIEHWAFIFNCWDPISSYSFEKPSNILRHKKRLQNKLFLTQREQTHLPYLKQSNSLNPWIRQKIEALKRLQTQKIPTRNSNMRQIELHCTRLKKRNPNSVNQDKGTNSRKWKGSIFFKSQVSLL